MAAELWQSRQARGMGIEWFSGVRFGIESGVWAIQKELMRDVL